MKTKLVKALGLVLYIALLCLLFELDWHLFLKPKPMLSVLIGTLILTACQYKRRMTRDAVLASLRWNAIVSGFLSTLVSIFSLTDIRFGELGSLRVTVHLLPLLYASFVYLLAGIFIGDKTAAPSEDRHESTVNLTATETAEKVFRTFDLTRREYHVAHKLLGDMSNKEIAADLYISESTVKKHIQNIYQKSGASDRASFRKIYFERAGNSKEN